MFFRLIRNDLTQNKLVNVSTLLFVTAAAALISLSAILAASLAGALGTFMEQSKTPHFVQMHNGPLNMDRLRDFAGRHPGVDDFQVVEFLNVDGARIRIGDRTLADSVQDNGFVIQNETFDFLLDVDGKPIRPADGDIHMPILYGREYRISVGDSLAVGGKTFTVAGFLRDSMMNASLSSSKRFLVSERDFAELKASGIAGTVEYLIEFRLKDPSAVGAFEADYRNAGLEANGPAVTLPLFRLLNALSDGIMIALLLLVGLLVASIAFLCIRLALLAKLEDDLRRIGVLKAIGLRLSAIKAIYLGKYAALAAAGAGCGFALSLAFKPLLLANIRQYMGDGDAGLPPLIFGVSGALLAGAAVVAFVNRVLNRIRSIPAARAIQPDQPAGAIRGIRRLTLEGDRLLGVNVFLGIKDVLSRGGMYGTLFTVLAIASFALIVPQMVHHTLSAKGFIRYMGIGDYDIRIDLPPSPGMAERAAEAAEAASRDPQVARHALYVTKTYLAEGNDGAAEWIKIELGDHAAFPVQYAEGKAPAAADEIALSVLLAEELGMKTGDTVTLSIGGNPETLRVSGIYSDITNGGKTAKAVFTDAPGEPVWSMVGIRVSDPALLDRKVKEYAARFPEARVTDVHNYVRQTFGSTVDAVKRAAAAAFAASILTASLVTMLFVGMLIAKDRRPFAIMQTIGFTVNDLTIQLTARILAVLIPGAAIGALLAATLGERLAGIVIASFGATVFQFETDPLKAFAAGPLALAAAVLSACLIACRSLLKPDPAAHLKE
jgi:putative ABC transport system permease protein